jgi:hypothetical protein
MSTYAAKNKFVPTDISRVIGVHASVEFQKFYFVLFASKTILYKYGVNSPLRSADPHQIAQFIASIYPQTDFYHHEFDSWKNNEPVLPIDQVLKQRFQQGCIEVDINTAEFNINFDRLFFSNFVDRAAEYQRVCDHVGIMPNTAVLHQLEQYHADNLELVTKIVEMPVMDFVSMSNAEAWPVISEYYQRLV